MGRGRAPPQLFAIGFGFSFLLGLVLLCVGLGFYVPELQKESEYVTLSSCSITSYREEDYDCSYESCGSCRRRLGEGTAAQPKSEGAAAVAAAAASTKTGPRRRSTRSRDSDDQVREERSESGLILHQAL